MKKNILYSLSVSIFIMLYSTGISQTIKEVKIDNQVWMTENLNVDKFRNGDRIPEAKTDEEWKRARDNKQPAWCYYDNKSANGKKLGRLYNFYAVTDPRGLAPEGWHIPTDIEWTTLVIYLGDKMVAGGKLKSTSNWHGKNSGASNSSGFLGLPGGHRSSGGKFYSIGGVGSWWSSTEEGELSAWMRSLFDYASEILRSDDDKGSGYSVRCIKN